MSDELTKLLVCSEEICVNNCERKAECDPGSFGKEYVENEKCPLNG